MMVKNSKIVEAGYGITFQNHRLSLSLAVSFFKGIIEVHHFSLRSRHYNDTRLGEQYQTIKSRDNFRKPQNGNSDAASGKISRSSKCFHRRRQELYKMFLLKIKMRNN
jgi:hypothetical protein